MNETLTLIEHGALILVAIAAVVFIIRSVIRALSGTATSEFENVVAGIVIYAMGILIVATICLMLGCVAASLGWNP